jgi:hypothetical protein
VATDVVSTKVVSGGVAEWFKATVLKTVARKRRGFESLLLLDVRRSSLAVATIIC